MGIKRLKLKYLGLEQIENGTQKKVYHEDIELKHFLVET
jgi:hypothetical protein